MILVAVYPCIFFIFFVDNALAFRLAHVVRNIA